ncbi:hypothetical protein AWZ03_015108 [Drosophila navojoa]|uniref:Uncharacterized protein n=1 Tax=Drosophila navojoa TaxID=7232 RepID=A0A484AS93_DRONA|nr:hypothetical protein AWZ03_015108 [Drosophila navojoa]
MVIEEVSDDEGSVRVEDASRDSTEPFSREGARSRQRDPRLGREYYRRQEERAPPRRVHMAARSRLRKNARRTELRRDNSDIMDDERGGRDPGWGDER